MADVKISALPASTTPLAGTEVLPIVQSSTTRQVSVANLTAGRAVNALSITASSLTSGRVTYAGTAGLLQDDADLTFDGNNLTISGSTAGPKLNVSSAALGTALQLSDNTNYGASFTGISGGLNLAMNGSQTFCITGGNVGIGNTAPTAKLDVSGNIVMTGVAWTSFTPTITASTGAFTTVSATGKYYIFGKTCTLNMIVDITTAGTATGVMYATLPFTSAARVQIGGYGMEVNATGSMLKGYIPGSSTQLQVTTYANATTIGSGFSNILTVVYEIV